MLANWAARCLGRHGVAAQQPYGYRMPLNETELKGCRDALAQFLKRRRPAVHVRDQFEIAYRISGHSVEISEVRPYWRDQSKKVEKPVAKATFVRAKNHWKIFWMRRDLKWHRYEPNLQVGTIEAFLDVVDRDEFACFFG